MAEFQDSIQADAPAYYFLDIDAKDLPAFRDTAKSVEPNAKLADAPMLRGRIVAINGVPAEKVQAAPDSRWVLASDRGLTYTDKLPEGRPSPRENGGSPAIPDRRSSPSTPTPALGSV